MKTILLVEDHQHIMQINSKALIMYGYHVLQAENAAQCREILASQDADLIVLDIIQINGSSFKCFSSGVCWQ